MRDRGCNRAVMASTFQLALDERRAAALSRLLRHVTWSDLSAYASDVEEALLMRDALDTIGRALVLGEAGRTVRRGSSRRR
ncbi:conserved protein of unknown function (plasmid) [Cupriavidus neocaledonicus]|uniref:Uncharacterized protein n=2 Tax=Burkholderiaceae TaxID=119060 RepID=A0A375HRP4_9BURK|nr:hypothetical protein CBM2605_B40129 [Cupriavidus neocaledonicus]SPD60871.1 conserved protein of unknown function [Cupriavidus neocaledonicus]